MNEHQFLSLVFAGTGILFVLISIPLARRKIRPNMFYGVRTRKTLSNEKLWYEANYRFGKDLILSGTGVFLVATAIGIFGTSLDPDTIAVIFIAAVLTAIAFAAIRCWRACEIF
jgi:uncharacterized membrane protein